jgi:hypothetical protein
MGSYTFWLRIQQYGDRVLGLPRPKISGLWSQINRQQRGALKLSILEILPWLNGFDATDPRDMIFAIYHLATDIPADSFCPDYTKSLAETYALFKKFIIEKTKSLRVFSFGNGWDNVVRGLPTWVPDFRKLDSSRSFFGRGYHLSESGNTSIPRLHSSTSTPLVLEGVQISTIEEVIGIKVPKLPGRSIWQG